MSASPHRPAQLVGKVTNGWGKQCGEQVLDLVAGDRDQSRWRRVVSALGQGGDHQEGMRQHGKGGPPVPGAPAADLMGVQADQALGGLEALLDGPAAAGDPDQGGKRHRMGHPAAVESQLAGLAVAADQQPALASQLARSRAVVVEAEECPVVVAVALGAFAA
jgi:hypothetical protein